MESKLAYEVVPLNQHLTGAVAEVLKDSINGDSFVVSAGKNAVIIKVKDVVNYVAAEEQKKSEESNKQEKTD